VSPRPRLLFLSQTLPYPPVDGVTLRTFHTLRILSDAFDIDAVCFVRRKKGLRARSVDAARSALAPLADVSAFPIPQQDSRLRFAWDHLRSVVEGRAYTYYLYESSSFGERVEDLVRHGSHSLYHIDTLDLSRYLDVLDPARTVCVHHNVESALLDRRAAIETGRARAAYLTHQAGLMRREERRWCGRLAANVAVSEDDAASLAALDPRGRYWVFPNGVDTDEYRPGPADAVRDEIVFVGGSTWFPNRDALDFFRADILPELRAAGCDAPVSWVGHCTDRQKRDLSSPDLVLTGFVPDIRPHVHRAGCYVVPLRVGGGTRLKIVHAWAMGKAVVSTSVGCEGLDARDGENLLVRDDPGEFARAVKEVLENRNLRVRLERGGRATAETTYAWDVIGDAMRHRYLGLLTPNAIDAPAGELEGLHGA